MSVPNQGHFYCTPCLDALAFARQLLVDFLPDDSKVMSAPIVGSFGG